MILLLTLRGIRIEEMLLILPNKFYKRKLLQQFRKPRIKDIVWLN
jgi:hypothetical protein